MFCTFTLAFSVVSVQGPVQFFFCVSLISCFPFMLLKYFLSDFEIGFSRPSYYRHHFGFHIPIAPNFCYKIIIIIIIIIKWAGHVKRMGEKRGCIRSCWGNWRERDHWGDLGVDELIILGRISRRWDVGIWTGLGWPRIETVGGRL